MLNVERAGQGGGGDRGQIHVSPPGLNFGICLKLVAYMHSRRRGEKWLCMHKDKKMKSCGTHVQHGIRKMKQNLTTTKLEVGNVNCRDRHVKLTNTQ